jgi:hypothetical protein
MALPGCGGGGAQAVAHVQGSAISQSALAHWSAIKRIELQRSATGSPTSGEVMHKALAFLITSEWLQREAAAQGVTVSAAEVNAGYQRLSSGPNGQSFTLSLKRRGLSRADELLILRLATLGHKLTDKIVGGRHGVLLPAQRRSLSAFLAEYRRRWRQRTSCQPGYVIAECGNGPPLPSSPSNSP